MVFSLLFRRPKSLAEITDPLPVIYGHSVLIATETFSALGLASGSIAYLYGRYYKKSKLETNQSQAQAASNINSKPIVNQYSRLLLRHVQRGAVIGSFAGLAMCYYLTNRDGFERNQRRYFQLLLNEPVNQHHIFYLSGATIFTIASFAGLGKQLRYSKSSMFFVGGLIGAFSHIVYHKVKVQSN